MQMEEEAPRKGPGKWGKCHSAQWHLIYASIEQSFHWEAIANAALQEARRLKSRLTCTYRGSLRGNKNEFVYKTSFRGSLGR